MPMFDESIEIRRPRQEVWDFLTTPENQTLWQSAMMEFEADWAGRDPQVGDRAHGVSKVAGKRIEWTSELTQVDPAKTLAFETVEAPFPIAFRYTYEDVDGGTRYSVHGETPETGGYFGKIGDQVAAKMYSRSLRGDLESLKALLEDGDLD